MIVIVMMIVNDDDDNDDTKDKVMTIMMIRIMTHVNADV